MKVKTLLFVGLIAVMCLAIDCYAELPNLETSMVLSNNGVLAMGLTSKLVSVKDIDLRVGYTEENQWIGSLSYDLKKLEKIGGDVNYAWKDALDLSLGFWAGWDFDNEEVVYGLMAVLVEIKF